jgi:hypothetical protein
VNQDPRGLRDLKVYKVNQDLKATKVFRVSKGPKVPKVLRVLKAYRVNKDRKVLRCNLANYLVPQFHNKFLPRRLLLLQV